MDEIRRNQRNSLNWKTPDILLQKGKKKVRWKECESRWWEELTWKCLPSSCTCPCSGSGSSGHSFSGLIQDNPHNPSHRHSFLSLVQSLSTEHFLTHSIPAAFTSNSFRIGQFWSCGILRDVLLAGGGCCHLMVSFCSCTKGRVLTPWSLLMECL